MNIKKRLVAAVTIPTMLLILLYIASWFFFHKPDFVNAGQLNTSIIESIELITPDDNVVISDLDEINAILSCFYKDTFAVPRYYDLSNVGGCAGNHWNTGFIMILSGNGHKLEIRFSECDSFHEIKREFIILSVNHKSRLFFLPARSRFLLGGYDLQSLSDSIGKYIDVGCVN